MRQKQGEHNTKCKNQKKGKLKEKKAIWKISKPKANYFKKQKINCLGSLI